MQKLFSEWKMGTVSLKNRVVMSPMTRCRAPGATPNAMMATYYSQRASAGLIITEGTSPSPNGLGYARIPGLYNNVHVKGWKLVTDAVHAQGGKIFVQLMHTGRASHPLNMPAGARILAPSAIRLSGQMWTDQMQMQPYPVPSEMTLDEIKKTIAEYVQSARLAIEAGFDGVELHGANGYLIDQFLNPGSNQRKDSFGGSAENRIRFALEIAKETVKEIGGSRLGIRISPYGAFNDMISYDGMEETYALLATELSKLGLAYIHIVDHSSMGAPEVKPSLKSLVRKNFKGTLILSGGYDAKRANSDLSEGKADLVAFGRPFIANPDLVEKLKTGATLIQPDPNTFYTPGEKGYL